jgi:hypothetical protein
LADHIGGLQDPVPRIVARQHDNDIGFDRRFRTYQIIAGDAEPKTIGNHQDEEQD